MKYKIAVSICVLAAFLLSAQTELQTYDEVFASINTIPSEYQAVIDQDFTNYTAEQLLDAFIAISGDNARKEELVTFFTENAQNVFNAVNTKFTSAELADTGYDARYALADYINQQMHTFFLRAYNKKSFTAAAIKDKKNYDCVSASILYAGLLACYNIRCVPIETADHVLVKVILQNKEVDVETTNFYGFDPGTKKQFQANFGKTTGFTYVAPGNYKKRGDLSIHQLLSLVVQNSVYILTQQKEYLRAARLANILRIMRNDTSGENSYNSAISNLANIMSKENNRIQRYDEAYRWMQILPENQNKRALLNNTYLTIVNNAEKTGNYQEAYKNLDLSLNYGVKTNNTEYIRFRKMLTNNTCITLMGTENFQEARELIFWELDNKVLSQNDLHRLMKSVCTKESNTLYNQKQYKQAIVTTLDCLEFMPKDQVLVNNLRVYYKEYVEYLKTADPQEVRSVIAEARKRFPSEKSFQDLVLP